MIFRLKQVQPIVILFGLLILMMFPVQAQDSAILLGTGETAAGTFGADNRSDVYRFDADAGSTVAVTVTSEVVSVAVLLTDSNGTTLGEAVSDAGSAVISDVTIETAGQFLVTVFALAESGEYQIVLAVEGTEVEATEAPTEAPAEVTAEATEVVVEETPAATGNGDVVTTFEPSTDILINNGMEVRLQWDTEVDLNLEVRDPRGNTLYYDSRTSPVGGSFGFDANGLCEVISSAPAESATWQPGFLPSGSYEILVFYRQSCADVAQAVSFALSVTVNGQPLDAIEGVIQPPPANTVDSVYLANFVVATDGTATINAGGAYPDTAINQLPVPAAELTANAVAVTRDVAVQGAIFEAQDYIAYTFGAQADEVLSISMNATSGNLDTLLQLVDPNGNLIAVNDDSNGTNSLINNIRIVQTGNYVIVATRYGKDIGGTEGEFELVVSETSAALPPAVANLNLPAGSIEVFLTWATNHDLQLLVRDPVGQSVYDDEPTVTSGGLLAANGNVNCQATADGNPVSYIYWPLGLARPGTYETEVWFQNTCDDTRIAEFNLTIVVNDQVVVVERQVINIGDKYVITFTIGNDGTTTAGQGGFTSNGIASLSEDIANETVLPIQPGTPINASITVDNVFDVYTFEGSADQTVTIFMQQTSQTLDTNLFLIDANGIQVAANDDADPAQITGVQQRPTDSLISNFTLPADGEYRIVATRYGTRYGGTIGTYRLTLQTN
jgi:hypothetical protein